MASRDCDYRFLQLLDAMASINQTVNLIGVVVDASIPKKSKGTDCFCTVKIVDESYSSPGILVNFFAENMEKLPHVESAGDIIQLSHVVMKTYEKEIYILFNKKFSSFALFDGKFSTNRSLSNTPPVTVQTKLEDEMLNPIPLDLQQFPLSRDILCTFPAVGTVLRMIVDQGNTEKLGLHLLKLVDGLRYLPNDDPLVLQSQRDYDKRVSSKWAWMPLSSIPWPSYITVNWEALAAMDTRRVRSVTVFFVFVFVFALAAVRSEGNRKILGTLFGNGVLGFLQS
ncbi:Protection of telomeres protein 1c [Camellia lanceoleosa]|uniref:Protection of telomeres protein 1c n=1 Tax=Camellia lanceoleosa TaxID=1840588 RepID=A0ACC0GYL8_9ERIC|nr:Protection of telomeres protein 1c [Camellia lanceoleosa]